MDSIYEKACSLQNENKSFVVATIIKSKGSAPRHNAKMIVTSEKDIFGTIGGGPLEHYVIEESIKAILKKESTMLYYRLDINSKQASLYTDNNKNIEKIEMLCGGDIDIFIEFVPSAKNVYLIGSGHVNASLAHILNFLGYNYFVVATHDSHLNKNKFINANFIESDTFSNAIKGINFSESDIVIIATFNNDEESLRELIKKDLAFLGMIGSRKKVHTIKEKLLSDNTATLSDMKKLHSPLGLDLGGESPEDIAISIMSLIMMTLNNSSGESKSSNNKNNNTIIVRGGGDIATGVVLALKKVGFNIIVLEKKNPTVIRRAVSIANGVYEECFEIEGIKSVLAKTHSEALVLSKEKHTIPILIDEDMTSVLIIKPFALIDATISKKNMGLNINLASVVIALGSGFSAGVDCHYVIETMRGHDFGRIIYSGYALENTGVPAEIMGVSTDRLLKSPCAGIFNIKKDIGSIVQKNDCVASVTDSDGTLHIIKAKIDGVVRGMLKSGIHVESNFKVGDIDPRGNRDYAFSVSEKARSLGMATIFAILEHKNNYSIIPKGD